MYAYLRRVKAKKKREVKAIEAPYAAGIFFGLDSAAARHNFAFLSVG